MKKFIVVALSLMFCGVAFADEARIKDLYATYGQLQIQAEIIAGQTQQVKQAIAQELQKPQVEPKVESKVEPEVAEKK